MAANLFNPTNRLLTLIFVAIFWNVISNQINYYSGVDPNVIGFFKYIIILILVATFFLINIKFRVSGLIYLPLVYFFYLIIHIISDNNIYAILNALRFEVLPVLFGVLLIIYLGQKKIDSRKIRIWMIGFEIVILLVALIEYFNRDVLIFLYRRAVEDIPHTYWFSIPRLISVAENPIILGLHMSFLMALLLSLRPKRMVGKVVILTLMSASLFVAAMTLSRTTLIACFIIYASYLYLSGSRLARVIYIVISLTSMFFVISWVNESSSLVIDRFDKLTSVEEYTGNLRLVNWLSGLQDLNVWQIIWGRGLGSSSPSYSDSELYGTVIIESTYVSLLINIGILGLVIYLLILFLYFRQLIKIHKSHPTFFIAHLFFLIAFIIFSVGNDMHRNMPFSYIFWIMYALAVASNIKYVHLNNWDKK